MWFDLILLALFLGVTYAVASQGMWGAVLMLINVLFAGLLAMNFFEPAADMMASLFGAAGDFWYDLIAIMVIFCVALFGLRMLSDSMSPMLVRFSLPLDQAGRWFFGAWTAWLAVSIIATAVHTAPLPREFIGFSPTNEKFLGMNWPRRPDRQWLAFTQRCSERIFERSADHRYTFDLWVGEQWNDGQSQGRPPSTADAQRSFIARYASRRGVAAGGTAPTPQSEAGGDQEGDALIF